MATKSSWKATLNELIAGSVGGAAQVLVGHPLDTVKTRAQIAPKGMFVSNIDIRKEGFFALYKGMASPLLGIAGVNSLLFAAYGVSKRIVSPYPQLSLPETSLAGAMAGAANTILASPVEMFKVTMAREIPAYAGFYTAYEFSKRKFASIYGSELPVWALLASGSSGGIAYWLSCYPLDVIKSRVQLRQTPPIGTPVQYIAHEAKTVLAESGLKGLFSGLTPSLIRSIPAAASTFAAFEITREYLAEFTGV
ncbi:hypothetical protein HHX47_DHR1001554 [Lentinula edodes]|nr:hypothetical protein HHX47_DHR1001554 [Lentinula edodes]